MYDPKLGFDPADPVNVRRLHRSSPGKGDPRKFRGRLTPPVTVNGWSRPTIGEIFAAEDAPEPTDPDDPRDPW